MRFGGWYQRIFAAVLARGKDTHEGIIAERKRALLSELEGDLLEIGPGSGSNLAYFAPGVRWVGVEPNPHMHPYLHQTAARLGMPVDLRMGVAEALPARGQSMDAVVSTLVLCSVHNPTQVLAEVQRVLRPGGRFVFLEHVAAPAESRLRRLQNSVRPLWQLFGDGCHPNRETWTAIQGAGFAHVQLERFDLPIPFIPNHIVGYAVKR